MSSHIVSQSSLFATGNSEADLRNLESIIRSSIIKTPLKQISGIYEEENPELSISSPLDKSQNSQIQASLIRLSTIKRKIVEQAVNLKYEITVISFTDRSSGKELPLEKSLSFFQCFVSTSVCLKCTYKLENQSTFEIYSQTKENTEELLFTINLDTVKVQLQMDRQNQYYRFGIITEKHRLIFTADQEEGKFIQLKLKGMHLNSLGVKFELRELEQRSQYFKQRYVTEQQFVNNCQTGDILLFQDSHFSAKVQRFLTGSNFDHVGMVIKNPHYGVLIFQSNSKSGVCLTLWKSLISNRWFKYIPKITWRRLTKIQKNPVFEAQIRQFVMKNLQKSFDISPRIITAFESVIVSHEDDEELNEGHQKASGYFCSELIATLYKNLGLLTRVRTSPNYQPACKFYPKDFSELSGRHLDHGQLSPESQIYFDPKLLCRNYPEMSFEADFEEKL